MKKFLLSCALMLAGVPVGAKDVYGGNIKEGDVFYCVTTAFASSGTYTDWKLTEYSAEKFKVQIAKDEILIKGGNFFKEGSNIKGRLNITTFFGNDDLQNVVIDSIIGSDET